ncbi:MAG: phosphoribosylformylglycinamidine cyclo-ligase [Bacteroidota bacterium]
MGVTYARAGVSIARGDSFVRFLRDRLHAARTGSMVGEIGLFGGFHSGRFPGYRHPVLVASTDGVGTKLLVAQLLDRHEGLGEDLVNHCVNDIAVCGARPLFFLDYMAFGRLSLRRAKSLVRGVAKACRENGCALLGGETAEMPGLYRDEQYDLAGTIVGVAERSGIPTGRGMQAGDVIIGLPSTGLHTNGYSLARKVLLKRFDLHKRTPELGMTLGDALLAVHRSYRTVLERLGAEFRLEACAHVTGGGIEGNTRRVVPARLRPRIRWDAWERPPLFSLIQRAGRVPERDMRRTFNLGIGLTIIVRERSAEEVLRWLRRRGERAVMLGDIGPCI